MNPKLGLGFILLLLLCYSIESKCRKGCDLALASYYVWQDADLTFIAEVMQSSILKSSDFDTILRYNPQLPSKDSLSSFIRINIPFPCDCIEGQFLGHFFNYNVRSQNTYTDVANTYYANLTTIPSLVYFNNYSEFNIPDNGKLNVSVNCSCGDSSVSKDYGLFMTYPLQPNDTLESIAKQNNVTQELLQRYNVGFNFSRETQTGVVYIPTKDADGSYRPLKSRNSRWSYCWHKYSSSSCGTVVGSSYLLTGSNSNRPVNATGSQGLTGITVDKSVEFSYEELAKATDDFSLANKIGEGGFGTVYYAELRGEKAAIKKMDVQDSKEFFAELKVLTHVHHLNLVRLIGYCVEGSLFVVYEYIENGNLSQHLRGSGKDPLTWSTRVQIALDSARGLEYIHEHTVPVYIHRDIKSANILIDKDFRGKVGLIFFFMMVSHFKPFSHSCTESFITQVADFGLTKLTKVGSASLLTRLVGTFGYMSPEYAQYGDVSPKLDVFAFGVVLYELISAKEAIVKANDSSAESRGLIALFEDVLNQPDPGEDLRKLVDPRLGEDYPLDSVRKVAQLAKACTHENPQVRPSMRSIVVALMTLSSSTEDWDVGSFYENQALVNLMSGR
ncbi:lysM domain receptor-like kinase 3 isoform X4 [Populus alba x Populus x berolinensis]|uniref:non-specific serine/threonine protein kinase n=1 Tax=Populus alba x Populus x berolinensis TaxID=444605 RepID=A0AAD6LU09_9ROSI|nr:lysM domain receptor-like kinase 3 isoform X4 [Populus alba x Populus x berolinensis]